LASFLRSLRTFLQVLSATAIGMPGDQLEHLTGKFVDHIHQLAIDQLFQGLLNPAEGVTPATKAVLVLSLKLFQVDFRWLTRRGSG
jgi:hypothetical protein